MRPLDECCIPCPDCSYVTCTERDGLCEHRNPVCESCCSDVALGPQGGVVNCAQRLGDVDGLICTRTDDHATGHTYESTSGIPDRHQKGDDE